MYKVLIVDDEPLIREGLRTIIDWQELGFEVAGTASDGIDALNKLEDRPPDLIIADIRMPGMDGLNLMREIQSRFEPSPHFIILSGYADFHYAREAMQMKADGYMLKPVDEDELRAYLQELKPTLDAEMRALLGIDSEWTRERIIVHLLAGEGKDITGDLIAHLGFDWSTCEIVLIRPQTRTEIESSAAADIKKKLAESFESSGRGAVFSFDPYLGVVLKNPASDKSSYLSAFDKIAEACRVCGLDFTATAGGCVDGPGQLEHSYRKALDLMKYRFFYDGDRIHDKQPQAGAGESIDGKGFDSAWTEEKLFLALDIGNGEAAVSVIQDACTAMLDAGISEQGVKTSFAQILTTVIGKLSLNRPEIRARRHAFSAELFELHREYRFSGLSERLVALAVEIAGQLQSRGTEKQIQKMTELIHRNYRENLKLESLAAVFNYNSSYLGKLFKTATGEYFNTYLDKVRIEKAKQLLEQGMKIYQVAEQVGYSNVDYFHSKFRKYVGKAPSAYRKSP